MRARNCFATTTSLADIRPLFLTSSSGADTLVGFYRSADLLDGGSGNDVLEGRSGSDTYVFGYGYGQDAIIDLDWINKDNDVLKLTAGLTASDVTFSRGGSGGNDLIISLAGSTDSSAVNGTGNDLDNLLIGNGAANQLNGGAGNDRHDGGAGNDSMAGGLGDDTYVVQQAGDVIVESPGEGLDTIESSITINASLMRLEGFVAWPYSHQAVTSLAVIKVMIIPPE